MSKPLPGVRCQQVTRPIASVGLYIPGGSAPLFSTVLMLATPARIAGCQQMVLCSPPRLPMRSSMPHSCAA
ncbi:histidinol dehydrogenase [Klebsiella pneumoniae]|uniref:histidinol dehydrogenase n=1 Tax=Klebsiella pneumoniae TaxID=573 RepID=A0A378FZU5_KLEPN|nr:histidinol dehydrogenase [Klebsiella pneumoniae]